MLFRSRAGGGIIAFANGTEDTVGADARAAFGNSLLSGYEEKVADESRAKFNFGEPKRVVPAPTQVPAAPVETADPAAVRQAQIEAAQMQAKESGYVPPAAQVGQSSRYSHMGSPTSRFKTPVAPSEETPAAPDIRVGRGGIKAQPDVSPRVAAARAFEAKQNAPEAPVNPARAEPIQKVTV